MSDISNNDETNTGVVSETTASAPPVVAQETVTETPTVDLSKENAALTARVEAAEKQVLELQSAVTAITESKKVAAIAEDQVLKPTIQEIKSNTAELEAIRAKVWGGNVPTSVRFK